MYALASKRPVAPGWRATALAALLLTAACGGDDDDSGGIIVPVPTPTPTPAPSPTPTPAPTPAPGRVVVDFSFQQTVAPWQAVFADYPSESSNQFEFRAGYSPVPANLVGINGFMLSSRNASDDVFMGVYRQVDGLRPNTLYRIDATITLASNLGANCAGAGGAPGEANFFKAGASAVVPEPQRTGYITLPVDKGVQGNDGRDMVIIGDLATPENTTCGPNDRYVRKTMRMRSNAPIVRSDAAGRLWLIAGTDSGFEGITTYYFLEGNFTLIPA